MLRRRRVSAAAAHRAALALVQMAREDGGLGLAPVAVEFGKRSASAGQGLLCGVEDLPGLGFCRLAEGELLAGTLQRSLRLGARFGLLQAQRQRADISRQRLQAVDAREQRGAAGEQRLMSRQRCGERLGSGRGFGLAAGGVGFSLGEAGDGFRQRFQAHAFALGGIALCAARSLGAQRGCGEGETTGGFGRVLARLCCALLCIKRATARGGEGLVGGQQLLRAAGLGQLHTLSFDFAPAGFQRL